MVEIGAVLIPGTLTAADTRLVLSVGIAHGEGLLSERAIQVASELMRVLDATPQSHWAGEYDSVATGGTSGGEFEGEWVGGPSAARILGVSESYVRRIAEYRLGGRKVNGKWRMPKVLVLDEKKRMEGRR